MKRSKPLQRTTRLRASGPIRPTKRSAARKRDTFDRCFHSDTRVKFVAELPCIVLGCQRTPCDNAHIETDGMSRKADASKIVPLCRTHHNEQHRVGARTFERLHHLDLAQCAAHTERQWQAVQSAPVPLSRIVPGVVAKIRGEA